MSKQDPKKAIRKYRDGYVDWFGRSRTEEEYLAQFEGEEAPQEKSMVQDSGIPGESALLDAGLVTIEDVHNALGSLMDIDGIGKKTAEQIKDFLENIQN